MVLPEHGNARGWQVVLVWHDPPSDLAASKNLVNNLDLSVRASGLGGHKIWGNGDRDDTNNVEMMYFPNMPQGTLAITVEGVQIPQGPQAYAVTVLGQFEGIHYSSIELFACVSTQ